MQKLPITIAAAMLFSLGASQSMASTTRPSAISSKITEFGAVADGTTLNTTAIQKTIDHVATSGGGTVVIPEGVFLSGSIFLKPGVDLQIDKNGVLKGSTNVSDYPKMTTRIEGHFQPWLPALVNADHIDHLHITGEGTLDGSGQPFWTAFRTRIASDRTTKNLDVERPRLVFIANSDDVTVSGLHFKDSGFWNLHIYHSQNVLVENLDIRAGPTSPSTDGMDIDSSQHIDIRGCTFSVNDDGIALKGTKGPLAMDDKDSPPVEHIHVSNCTFEHAGSMVTCGSEATYVHDVIVENCTAKGPGTRGMSVLRLKLRTDTPQHYEDIHVRNITLVDGAGAIINMAPWTQYFDLQGHPQPTRRVNNISISDVKGTFGSFGSIRPNEGDVIDGVTFENIDVKLTNANAPLVGVTNLTIKNVNINGEPFNGPQK